MYSSAYTILKAVYLQSVMHNSYSGIRIDSGITFFFWIRNQKFKNAGIEIEIEIKICPESCITAFLIYCSVPNQYCTSVRGAPAASV